MSVPKIAIMHYSSAPVVGGVESVIREHSSLFADAGYPVTVFSGRGEKVDPNVDFRSNDLFHSSTPRILKIKESLDQGTVPDSFEPVKNEIFDFLMSELTQFDIIFAHNICSLHKNLPLTTALYAFLQQYEKAKLISWDHDLAWKNNQYRKQLFDAYPWDLLKKTWHPTRHRHVTVSDMRKKELEQLLGDTAFPVLSIPSGIDWESILNLGDQALNIIQTYSLMDAYPVLFLPARITRRKNIELAISITAAMRTAFPSIALVISGPLGPHNPKNREYFNELQQLASQNTLDKVKIKGKPKVIFLAEYDQKFLPMSTIYDLFRFTDVLLFPSFQEGFGIPILEAGMTQKPIFCSDIPPFHETANSMAHYFDPFGDPMDIANEIVNVIKQQKILNHKFKVKQQYTWNNIFTQQIEPLVLSNKKKE